MNVFQPRPLGTAMTLALAASAFAQHPAPATGTRDHVPGNIGVPAEPRGSATRVEDRQFMQMAAEAAHAAIGAARVALQRSENDGVRRLARRLIDDHTETHARLQALAAGRGFALPRDASAMEQAKLTLLQSEDRGRFDGEFLRIFGVQAHREAVELFERERAHGKDPELKAFAASVLPTLREHLRIARQQLDGGPSA